MQPDPSGTPALSGSIELGSFFGIAVRLHWSFLLLIGWLALVSLGESGSLGTALSTVLGVAGLFSFVVAHEYGHALMARRFGIATREITLLPIGGVAQLERMPEDPRQELLVALAGPAVNVFFVLVSGAAMHVAGEGLRSTIDHGLLGGSALSAVFRINLIMALFNLLPALPMDGGRVLRALLSLRLPPLKATLIASSVARGVAALFVMLGLIRGSLIIAVIGGFVWIASGAEVEAVRARESRRRHLRIRLVRRPGGGIALVRDVGEATPGAGPTPRIRTISLEPEDYSSRPS